MRYRLNSDGTKTPIAGRGKAEYGASTIRTGTYTIDEIVPGGALWTTFTFSDPMPDGDYMVDFSFPATASIYAQAYEKNAANVKVSFRNISTNDTFTNIVVNYTCYKLYTDTEYNGLIGTRLDEIVDLKYYTSSFYTTKSDGYICLGVGTSTTGMAGITVYDSNENALCSMLVRPDADRLLAYSCQSLYVKKGMKIKLTQNTLDSTDFEVGFRSLKV